MKRLGTESSNWGIARIGAFWSLRDSNATNKHPKEGRCPRPEEGLPSSRPSRANALPKGCLVRAEGF